MGPVLGSSPGPRTAAGAVGAVAVILTAMFVALYPVVALVGGTALVAALVTRRIVRRRRRRRGSSRRDEDRPANASRGHESAD